MPRGKTSISQARNIALFGINGLRGEHGARPAASMGAGQRGTVPSRQRSGGPMPTKVNRLTVDLSQYPKLVVIYLGMRRDTPILARYGLAPAMEPFGAAPGMVASPWSARKSCTGHDTSAAMESAPVRAPRVLRARPVHRAGLPWCRMRRAHHSARCATTAACFQRASRPWAKAASNRASSVGETPRMGSTTCLAQAKYSALRSADQSTGGEWRMSRTLQILSASLTSLALALSAAACAT